MDERIKEHLKHLKKYYLLLLDAVELPMMNSPIIWSIMEVQNVFFSWPLKAASISGIDCSHCFNF